MQLPFLQLIISSGDEGLMFLKRARQRDERKGYVSYHWTIELSKAGSISNLRKDGVREEF